MSETLGQFANTPLDPSGDKVTTHGFLIAMELEPKTDLNKIVFEIMASCVKNTTIRDMDIEHLGELDVYENGEDKSDEAVQLTLPMIDTNKKAN